MKPSLRSIVNSMPSLVDVIGATVHTNRACGVDVAPVNGMLQTKGIPDDVCSYSWGDIFNEMLAQGYVPAGGEFYRGRTNQ